MNLHFCGATNIVLEICTRGLHLANRFSKIILFTKPKWYRNLALTSPGKHLLEVGVLVCSHPGVSVHGLFIAL